MADRKTSQRTSANDALRTPKKKRWWLRGLIAVIVVIVILVALAPTLVSLGIGQGYIESKINDSLNGKVSLGKVGLGWLGGQKVDGLTVTDAGGKTIAKVDVRISSSLLGLVTGTSSKMNVQVNGEAWGELREDGSVSFSDLIKPKKETEKEKKEREEREKKEHKPTSIAGLPDIAVDINSLTLNLLDVRKNRTIKVEGLKGTAQLAKGKDTTLDLAGTLSGAAAGSGPMSVNVKSVGLFDAQGVMHLADASLNAKVDLQKLPVPIDATLDSMDHLVVTADAAKLSESLKVSIDGAGRVEGASAASASASGPGATSIQGAITIGEPVNANGVVKINPAKVTGSVNASDIPTALAQAMLANTPVNVMRDLGPRADVQANFGAGESKELHITIDTERIKGEVRGVADADGAIHGTLAHFEASVAPELVLQSAGLQMDKPAQVVADFTQFSIPAAKGESGLALGELSATGKINIVNNAVIKTAEGELIGGVGPVEIAIESPGLGQWVSIKGGGNFAEGRIDIDERVTRLVNGEGKIAAAGAMPTGKIQFQGVPAELVKRLGKIQPSVIMDYAISGQIAGEVNTKEESAGTLSAVAQLRTDALQLQATAAKTGEDVEVRSADMDVKVTPKFFTDYMKSMNPAETVVATQVAAGGEKEKAAETKPIRLLEDATVHGALEGFKLARTAEGGYALPTDKPVVLKVNDVTDLNLDRVPGLSEAVAIRGLDATIEATLGELATYVAKGNVQIRRADGNAVANVAFDVNAKKGAEGFAPSGTVNVTDFSVGQLEKLMGAEAGSYTQWTGADKGGIKVEVSQGATGATDAKVHADFANLAGDFKGGMDAQGVWLTGETTKFVATKATVEKLLVSSDETSTGGSANNAKPAKKPKKKKKNEEPMDGDEQAAAPPPHVKVAADVPGKLKITELRLPMGAVVHGAFDPALAKMNVSLTAGTLALNHESGMKTQLSGLTADITSDGFNNGINVNVKADASVAEPDEKGQATEMKKAGGLTITGKVTDLMAEDSTLDIAEATWQADGNAKNVPTALLDAFGNMNGLATAALGPVVNATFKADDFSPTSGTLTLNLITENGNAELPLRGRMNALRTVKDTPLAGSLQVTKPFTEKVLQSLHPIFADVRTVEQPVKFSITNLVAPLNGDVSMLKADAQITVGAIELDSGSALLKIIKFAGRDQGTIKGFIDPIKITIRNGVVKYDTFNVTIDKFTMKYTGTIDLVKKEVNLKTEVPLEALGSTFKELQGIKTTVPIVTTGKIGNVKTKIDPSFDIGKAALEAGFKGKLEDILGGKKDEGKKP